MRRKSLVIFTALLLTLSFSPFDANASIGTEIDSEVISALQEQVRLLSLEVIKLQAKLDEALNPNIIYEPLSSDGLRRVIASSVGWFKESQEENGHFRYEYVPYENIYLPQDNIVRQAGGLYALGEVAINDLSNKYGLKDTLERGVQYFEGLSEIGEWNGYSFKCITNSSFNDQCQLGATSLALVGLIDTVTAYPELKEKYDSLIHSYGKYILAMKKDVGGFRHAYISGMTPSENESSFSNGEALLALARYYKHSPNEEVKTAVDDSFDYFNSESVGFDFPLYLWAMAAIKDIQELWPNDKYVKYVEAYTDWRLSGFAYRKGSNHNMCAYVEGVLSAYSVLENNIEGSQLVELEREINYWLRQSRKLQITKDDEYRILKDESGEYHFGKIEDLSRAKGGFITGADELTQRIDFTQHCLNSYIQQLVDVNKEVL